MKKSGRRRTPQSLVNYLMKSLGVSYGEYAKLFGVHHTTVRRWANGKSSPHIMFLRKMDKIKEVVDLALQVFKPEGVRELMNTVQPGIGPKTPLEYLKEDNFQIVLDVLYQDFEGLGY